ncbi:MAG TPA: PqqD family peptide modification chaperone [Croceibacterium sp.]
MKGTDIVVRNDAELLTTVVDGELIGMSIEQGACYGLNGIGTRIWDLLAAPRAVDGLVEQLTAEYEVEAADCLDEVLAFVEQLRAEGLVRVSAG